MSGVGAQFRAEYARHRAAEGRGYRGEALRASLPLFSVQGPLRANGPSGRAHSMPLSAMFSIV